jgi:hypothetical protein
MSLLLLGVENFVIDGRDPETGIRRREAGFELEPGDDFDSYSSRRRRGWRWSTFSP